MGMVGRRRFMVATGALLAVPRVALAQAQKRLPVLGILNPGSKPTPELPHQLLLLKRLRELGWVEGKTLRVERANAEFRVDHLPELASTLVAKKVDVIWTNSPRGAVAAARATTTIPIVFWRVGAPIEFGLVDSLARPGRNVTGLAWFADMEIYIKRIQLLREMVPGARRLAGLVAPPGNQQTVTGKRPDFGPIGERFRVALRELRFEALRVEVGNSADVEKASAQIEEWRADCLSVADVPETVGARKQIIDMARHLRLPDVYEAQEWIQAGGLFSYGIVFLPTLLRTAEMVDRILRGAKPADMPVELPSDYELTVNLKTAKLLDLAIPQSILLRADRVIE